MNEKVENLMLEQLRAIRVDMSRMADRMDTLPAEMSSVRQHVMGVVTIQNHDHIDIASIKVRLDRIERRLELADQ